MHLHLRFRRIVALVAGLLLTLSIHAQVITKSFRGVPLKTVLEEVEKQTGYSFLFESKEVDVDKPVTASFKNATIQTVLDKVLDGSLRYTINDKLVTISQRPRQGATVAKDGSVTLSGTVISSSDNQPIVGANVYVEGTTLGVTTDIDGNYSLTVPASTRQVTFSFLGYDMKKIAVKDSELFKLVTLVDASNELEDVVVVGFGVQKKESLVGAVQSVKPSELQVSSSNLSTSFAGKIAGVIAVQKTGEPGADGANFWIRGISTFGSGQSPLLILDGVEITSQMLNNIPPETIESFSVLKDATATALYGSRGANGGMIITRRGRHVGADARARNRRRRHLHGDLQRGQSHARTFAALQRPEDHGYAAGARSVCLSQRRLVRHALQGRFVQPEFQLQHDGRFQEARLFPQRHGL